MSVKPCKSPPVVAPLVTWYDKCCVLSLHHVSRWLLLCFLLFNPSNIAFTGSPDIRGGGMRLASGHSASSPAAPAAATKRMPGEPCFCHLAAQVDECPCTVDSVDQFATLHIQPLLTQLLARDFFRYYKVNMHRPCPFWQEDEECSAGKECGIEECDDEVPLGIKLARRGSINGGPNASKTKVNGNGGDTEEKKAGQPPNSAATKDSTQCPAGSSRTTTTNSDGSASGAKPACTPGEQFGNTIDPLDPHISDSARDAFKQWAEYDDAENKYCDIEDEHSPNMHYVDLYRNPERYTGYKGQSAARVWNSIYSENCFRPHHKFDRDFLVNPKMQGLCLEKRVFFRLISGLHTSITVQVSAHHYTPPPGGFGQGTWGPNINMFKWRFSEETTGGEGPQRLKNLYFVFALELRAIAKVAPYIRREMLYTGNEEEDDATRQLVEEIMGQVERFPNHFDERQMFQGTPALARQLKAEFREKFLNISRIMDCVGCDKCRLWGKVNIHGMATALKILFSDINPGEAAADGSATDSSASSKVPPAPPAASPGSGDSPGPRNSYAEMPFQLRRDDIVALFQSLGRYASSIEEVGVFKRLLQKGDLKGDTNMSKSKFSSSSKQNGETQAKKEL